MTTKPTYLTREAILGAQDIATETVDVPEWGGAIHVRGMSGKERDAFESSIRPPSSNGKREVVVPENLRARICALCIVDGRGNRLFSTEDVDALSEKSGTAIFRISEIALRLSGIGNNAVDEEAKAMMESPFEETSSPSPES